MAIVKHKPIIKHKPLFNLISPYFMEELLTIISTHILYLLIANIWFWILYQKILLSCLWSVKFPFYSQLFLVEETEHYLPYTGSIVFCFVFIHRFLTIEYILFIHVDKMFTFHLLRQNISSNLIVVQNITNFNSSKLISWWKPPKISDINRVMSSIY